MAKSYRVRSNLKVYRLENDKGLGPYRGTDSQIWRTNEHYIKTGRPTPLEERIFNKVRELNQKSKYKVHFGFVSKKQLFKWFSKKELGKLYSLGFKIKEYLPKKSYATRTQAFFVKSKKNLVKTQKSY